jgi:hypothetical protein
MHSGRRPAFLLAPSDGVHGWADADRRPVWRSCALGLPKSRTGLFSVPISSTPVLLDNNGNTVLNFDLNTKSFVVITYNAECAATGDAGSWVGIEILVDGKATNPKEGPGDFAFCSATGNEEIYTAVSRQAYITIKAGTAQRAGCVRFPRQRHGQRPSRRLLDRRRGLNRHPSSPVAAPRPSPGRFSFVPGGRRSPASIAFVGRPSRPCRRDMQQAQPANAAVPPQLWRMSRNSMTAETERNPHGRETCATPKLIRYLFPGWCTVKRKNS